MGMLRDWWLEWGHPIADADELSPTGFIIYEPVEDKPLLVGFMILTNAKFVLIETVCANPETSNEEREEAIIELVRTISRHAKELGFHRVLAFPQKELLTRKGEAAGMFRHPIPCNLLVKEIW